MYTLHIAGYLIIGLNVLISWLAWRNREYFNKLLFRTASVRSGEWYRLFSSGFLHLDYTHLFFNLFSFFVFAGRLEETLGTLNFVLLYFGSLLAGNLLALLYHYNDSEYRAVGASGAVSGVVFAFITLFPDVELSLMLLPFFFPAWIYGLLFIVYSIYGIGKQNDNIGHEAHLGGAVSGLFLSIAMVPAVISQHPLTIIYLVVPSLAFLIVSFYKPQVLRWNFGDGSQSLNREDRYRAQKAAREQELNRILEKVKHSGSDALTAEERRFLQDYH